jgi:hypothetical protein
MTANSAGFRHPLPGGLEALRQAAFRLQRLLFLGETSMPPTISEHFPAMAGLSGLVPKLPKIMAVPGIAPIPFGKPPQIVTFRPAKESQYGEDRPA